MKTTNTYKTNPNDTKARFRLPFSPVQVAFYAIWSPVEVALYATWSPVQVAFYAIWPGNRSGLFYNSQGMQGAIK